MTNRSITHRDRETAARCKSVWQRKKRELELTQAIAAKHLGISQASFSQYLSCTIALNTDMVLKLAALLRVDAGELDPELKQRLRVVDLPINKIQVAVIAAIPGPMRGGSVIQTEIVGMKSALYAVQLTEAVGEIPANSYVLLDPSREVAEGAIGVLTKRDQSRHYGVLISRTTKQLTFHDKQTGDILQLKPKEVFAIHPVHSVQFAG
jgi:hypothetical protein